MKIFFSSVVLTSISLSLVPRASGQGADDVLATIIKDWRMRRQVAAAVEYEAEGSTLHPKGRFTKRHIDLGLLPEGSQQQIPETDHKGRKKVRWIFHFANNWIRKETFEDKFFAGPNIFSPCYQADLYDGQDYKVVEPREKNTSANYIPGKLQPDVYYAPKNKLGMAFSAFDLPILFGHGVIPSPGARLTPVQLLVPIKEDSFLVSGMATKGNTDCTILKARSGNTVFEYWVDNNRQGAIVRCRQFVEDHIRVQVDTDFQNKESTWLPCSWSIRFYRLDEPGMLDTQDDVAVTITNLAPTINKEDFQFSASRGMIVREVENQKSYIVANSGALREVTNEAQLGETNAFWWYVTLVLSIVVFGTFGLALLFKRRQRAG